MTAYAETRSWPAGKKKSGLKVLAFGDPVYPKRDAESEKVQKLGQISHARLAATNEERGADPELAYLRSRGLSLAPLPWSRKEVEDIARIFDKSATVKLGRHATETSAKNESRDYTILHFAVHGWLDDQLGLASGLALSQPDALGREATKQDNGLLQAWEILEQVRLDADLVTLAACETGLGQTVRGEGLIGLTRAFQYAGARSVVVSLWQVNDASTADFMNTFYRELRRGATKDVALQKAMIAVATKPKWRHPFYWSAFTLVGDWR
jgi:CHAT domain-containing protein